MTAAQFLLIARKNGSSSSRRQRRFPDLASVDRAVERWRQQGYNTWWLFEGSEPNLVSLKQWRDTATTLTPTNSTN